MKADMFAALTEGASWSWFGIDMSWLDRPDIDLTSIFDGFDLSPSRRAGRRPRRSASPSFGA